MRTVPIQHVEINRYEKYERADELHNKIIAAACDFNYLVHSLTGCVSLRQGYIKNQEKEVRDKVEEFGYHLQELVQEANIECTYAPTYYALTILIVGSIRVEFGRDYSILGGGGPISGYYIVSHHHYELGLTCRTTANLISTLQYEVPRTAQCESCHYSNKARGYLCRYCGKGLTMFTGCCTQWRESNDNIQKPTNL